MKVIILIATFFIFGCVQNKEPAKNHHVSQEALPLEQVDFFSSKNGDHNGVSCPIEIRPGESIGPISIGVERGSLSSLGLKMKRLKDSPYNLLVGPYMVTITEGRVSQVSIQPKYLPEGCLMFHAQKIPKASTFENIQTLFKKCGLLEERFGGKLLVCDEVIISKGSASDSEVEIRVK